RLCPRIFTFGSIPKKFGGNSDRRHDLHAQRASLHTCAHPSNALRNLLRSANALRRSTPYAIPRTKHAQPALSPHALPLRR
ncbi:hypothetical protein ACTHSJ_14895, partial [Paenibacillus cellulositrophicus]|uniref:hypothetical protein n=1 Tax=Paenibacillus cellulositrophicus TaxID=562959 RepID=UPI003F7E4CD8